jgi:hypothetical protein
MMAQSVNTVLLSSAFIDLLHNGQFTLIRRHTPFHLAHGYAIYCCSFMVSCDSLGFRLYLLITLRDHFQ